ncbi:MAG TPA: YggT family protein [Anaerolineales bacterium]|nr:YggT family protein [Anaerolineales bacterium]
MTAGLIIIINIVSELLTLLVFIAVILSFFMDPYHPIRRGVDNIVEPMLAPIRRVVPLVGMFDFSPLILILLIQLIKGVLVSLLLNLR